MIASVFSKTRPFNYLITGILSLIFFLVKIYALVKPHASWGYYLEQFGLYVLLFVSLFLLNFISLKNGLTKIIFSSTASVYGKTTNRSD